MLTAVVFDVFVDKSDKVRLLGLAPFGSGSGEHRYDSCLFSWEELAKLARIASSTEESGLSGAGDLICEHGVCVVPKSSLADSTAMGSSVGATAMETPYIRVVESEELRFSRHAVYGFPDDLLDAASRGLGRFNGYQSGGAAASRSDDDDSSSSD